MSSICPVTGSVAAMRISISPIARVRIAAATPRALWLGWSLGGLVALRAALDYPANVRGLVMIASSPRFVSAPDWPHGVAADCVRRVRQ